MFEKISGKSKSEKEQNPEQTFKLGKRALLRESDSKIKPKRRGGYMLCTVAAIFLAMGMPGKAEAQVGGIGPQGHGFGEQVAGEVISEIGSALNRAQNAKQDRIEHGYVAQLTQLEDAMGQLDHQYNIQRSRLMREGGNQGNLKTLEDSHRAEGIRLMKTRAGLEKKYHQQKRNTAIMGKLTEAIIFSARGR